MGIGFKDKGGKGLLRTKVKAYFEEHQLPLDKKFRELDHDTMAKLLVECTKYINAEGYPWTVETTKSFVCALCHDGTRDSRKRNREEASEPEVVKVTQSPTSMSALIHSDTTDRCRDHSPSQEGSWRQDHHRIGVTVGWN
jgi:hypothetical protein